MGKPIPSPLVEVSGPPRERGRQYGEQARDRIVLGIAHYSEQLAARKLGPTEIRDLAITFEPTISAFDPAYVEEMKGIAEGAGVAYGDVVLLNARTEILKLAEQRGAQAPRDQEPDGCTGLALLPEATSSGRLIHAQNWDWKAECSETTVVLRIRREDGPDVLTYTEAGGLARSGMNAAGISITANYLESDRDYSTLGVPLPFIRRKALEQRRYAEALAIVYCTPKSCSNNMMLAQCNGVVVNLECAPDETFLVLPERGALVHANHFQSPIALSKLVERGVRNMPDSLYRDIRVRQLIEPHLGKATLTDAANALLDDFETPWSVCRPPRPSKVTNLSATVATVLMEPTLGQMHVAMLPALCPEFTTYELAMDIEEPKSAGVKPVFLTA
ncbi:MAG TPA: C45 family peptidase [Rhizobiaceae bacterium]|nr:C45 family peptidase [Rhizobiaceae bacterium]